MSTVVIPTTVNTSAADLTAQVNKMNLSDPLKDDTTSKSSSSSSFPAMSPEMIEQLIKAFNQSTAANTYTIPIDAAPKPRYNLLKNMKNEKKREISDKIKNVKKMKPEQIMDEMESNLTMEEQKVLIRFFENTIVPKKDKVKKEKKPKDLEQEKRGTILDFNYFLSMISASVSNDKLRQLMNGNTLHVVVDELKNINDANEWRNFIDNQCRIVSNSKRLVIYNHYKLGLHFSNIKEWFQEAKQTGKTTYTNFEDFMSWLNTGYEKSHIYRMIGISKLFKMYPRFAFIECSWSTFTLYYETLADLVEKNEDQKRFWSHVPDGFSFDVQGRKKSVNLQNLPEDDFDAAKEDHNESKKEYDEYIKRCIEDEKKRCEELDLKFTEQRCYPQFI